MLVAIVGLTAFVSVQGSLGDPRSQLKFRSTKGGSVYGRFTQTPLHAVSKHEVSDDDETTVKFGPGFCIQFVM